MTGQNGDKIVVWTNAVVDARYTLSVPEQRLILWLAAQIEREDDALDYRTVGVLELQEIAGGTGKSVYERFEAVCDKLQSRVLEIRFDEGRIREKINWLHKIRYNDGEGTITLRFHDDLKPALLQIKERFSKIPLKTLFRFQGGYAIRWYEMCKAKEYLGTFSMSVEEVQLLARYRGARASLGQEFAKVCDGRPQGRARQESGPLVHVRANQNRAPDHRLDLQGQKESSAARPAATATARPRPGAGGHARSKSQKQENTGRLQTGDKRDGYSTIQACQSQGVAGLICKTGIVKTRYLAIGFTP